MAFSTSGNTAGSSAPLPTGNFDRWAMMTATRLPGLDSEIDTTSPVCGIERSDHVRESGDALAGEIRGHELVVDAEHRFAVLAPHGHLAEIEAAAIGHGVLRDLAVDQQLAAKKFNRRADAIGAAGREHGAAEIELERDGARGAVLPDEARRQRTARGIDQPAIDHGRLPHHIRGADDVAFGDNGEFRLFGLAAAAAQSA